MLDARGRERTLTRLRAIALELPETIVEDAHAEVAPKRLVDAPRAGAA